MGQLGKMRLGGACGNGREFEIGLLDVEVIKDIVHV